MHSHWRASQGGGKTLAGLSNHAWEDTDGKGVGRRADDRMKDVDRWGVKGGLLADNLPKNGFGASVKLRDDDRAIGVPPGRPVARLCPLYMYGAVGPIWK